MSFGFSEETTHALAAADTEKREGSAEALLARTRAVMAMWKDASFLATIEVRLGIDSAKEATRRLNSFRGDSYWKRATRKSAQEVARYLDLETVEQILTLPEKEQRKIKQLNVVLEGVMLRITWEEARLLRIPDAIEATQILEDAVGKGWEQTRYALVRSSTAMALMRMPPRSSVRILLRVCSRYRVTLTSRSPSS